MQIETIDIVRYQKVASLGDLERSVMDQLWDSAEPLTANDLRDKLAHLGDSAKELAVTTVLTVLARLEKKSLVQRERSSRPHRYSPVSSREDHTVELLNDALGTAQDREAVLARFIGGISPDEATALRAILDSTKSD